MRAGEPVRPRNWPRRHPNRGCLWIVLAAAGALAALGDAVQAVAS